MCNTTSRQYCDIYINDTTNMIQGECIVNTTSFEKFPTYIQYPGEICDSNRAFFECGFGYRKCNVQRCYGRNLNENCE
jgi:hypothetical protein